jgi:type II secretory pathway pseudopilin PulG
LKKNKIQNISIAIIGIIIVIAIIAYNYSADQTKQKGFQFGNELAQIQQDVAELQTKFYSEKIKWDEGDITKEELLNYYETHVGNFENLISMYDKLDTPELFESSVELFKISSETQLKSDIEYIKWITTGDESAKVRSDTQIQEAYEYENLGLVEFQLAKAGIIEFDEADKFSPPDNVLKQKVIQISENMKNKCDLEFKNEMNEFNSNEIEIQWFNCINEAEEWKTNHLP